MFLKLNTTPGIRGPERGRLATSRARAVVLIARAHEGQQCVYLRQWGFRGEARGDLRRTGRRCGDVACEDDWTSERVRWSGERHVDVWAWTRTRSLGYWREVVRSALSERAYSIFRVRLIFFMPVSSLRLQDFQVVTGR